MSEKQTRKADIALIGLAVMGENLALNLERNHFTVAVANRTPAKIDAFLAGRGKGKNFIGCHKYTEIAAVLTKPRTIFMMVKAGAAVDELIDALLPTLEPDDILIDGGNSYFLDTERRVKELSERGILFVGCGVSGGETGALLGPSLMPGGNPAAWPTVKPLLQTIAAKADDGTPCCEWVGNGGAGHFVKMVHNGIEYGDMQLISESYALLHQVPRLATAEIAEEFRAWNKDELASYLIEITAAILAAVDPVSNRPMLDLIRDTAGQKGTGRWTSECALELGVAAPTITEAVYARCVSAEAEERERIARLYSSSSPKFSGDVGQFTEDVRQALYAAKICSYAQGFQLMRKAAERYLWKLDFAAIASLWRGGCIIRAGFLNDISQAYRTDPELSNLLLDAFFQTALKQSEKAWRRSVANAATFAVPCPALSTSLAWFDSVRNPALPTSLIQAQRDYFGAHTYERTDRERGIFFHTDWNGDGISREV